MQYEPTHLVAIAMAQSGGLGDLRRMQALNGQNDMPGQWRQGKSIAGGGSLSDTRGMKVAEVGR